jgi:acyl-CoA thioesterase-2
MPSAIADLLTILDLEPLEVNLFRGRSPQVGWQRVFGGQVIGQALVAACRTLDVASRPPHSMHAYFLLAGDPKVPIIYNVERVRDGKSFTTRRVTALQHGQVIFITSVSFHRDEAGLSHQAKMPDVPKPEDLAQRSRDPRAGAAADARSGAALLRARATDRAAPGRVRPLSGQGASRRPLPCLDSSNRPIAQ